jgi:cell division protein FtsZ
MFELVEENSQLARIRVVGVGGAGGNAVNRMVEAGLNGVEFLAINTDAQALRDSRAQQALQIGCQLTRGLGSGGDPRIGRKAMEEDREAIAEVLEDSDMIFVTAGMGGGTGTGAAPVIAAIARELSVLTVGIVTKPFSFEGEVRRQQAEEGIIALAESVDTLIIIPNERLLEIVPPSTSVREAFRVADSVLYEATRGIHDIISRPNHVNLDFADVRTVMKGMGVALMGTGRAEGDDRAAKAAREAISSPLLEDIDIKGAQAVLVNLLGSDIGIQEIAAAMSLIQDAAGSQAHIIFGYGTDDALGDTIQVTVIATGFQRAHERSYAAAVWSQETSGAATEQPASRSAEQPPARRVMVAAAGAAAADAQAQGLSPVGDEQAVSAAESTAPPAPAEYGQPAGARAAMAPLPPGAPPRAAALAQNRMEPRDVPPAPAEASASGTVLQRPQTPPVQDPGGIWRFLRPVQPEGWQPPQQDGQAAPVPLIREQRGFRSDRIADLSEPAYTRKYMD